MELLLNWGAKKGKNKGFIYHLYKYKWSSMLRYYCTYNYDINDTIDTTDIMDTIDTSNNLDIRDIAQCWSLQHNVIFVRSSHCNNRKCNFFSHKNKGGTVHRGYYGPHYTVTVLILCSSKFTCNKHGVQESEIPFVTVLQIIDVQQAN
jgi:hypothetical protein